MGLRVNFNFKHQIARYERNMSELFNLYSEGGNYLKETPETAEGEKERNNLKFIFRVEETRGQEDKKRGMMKDE